MKTKPIVLLLVLIASCLFLVQQPNTEAQSGSNIVNIPLTFHGYSLLLRDPNGSFCVYDGADGAAPTSATPTQANLVSQISGQQSGFSYWSASILWTIKLQSDLHVVGTVNIKAYISSTFKLSGLFSGGGYGMGLVDIDQNNNEVQQFITQGPTSIGSNPFTSSPTQYSLNTNVDYVFKKDHSIGFAVGFGATVQGFSATVFFDSTDKNSGATLPVEVESQSNSFTANTNGTPKNIVVVSDSAISNYEFNSASSSIQFKAQGINYTTGYCSVNIPKTLMQSPFTVTSGSQPITATSTENSTYYQLYFTHARNSSPIQITGTSITTQPTSTPSESAAPSIQPTTQPSTTTSSTSSTPVITSPGETSVPSPDASSQQGAIPEYKLLAIPAVLIAVVAAFVVMLKKRLKIEE